METAYTVLGEDGQRGFLTAMGQAGNKAGGKDLEVIVGSTDTTPEKALQVISKLVEQDKVFALVGDIGLRLAGGTLSAETTTAISTAVGSITATTDAGKLNRVLATILLVMASPEYQIQK